MSKNHARLVASLLVCFIFGAIARADIPRPRPTPEPQSAKDLGNQLIVSTDPALKEAHLRLPLSALHRNGDHKGPRADAWMSPVQTVMAGLALTGAITCGGLLLARGRVGRGRMLTIAGLIGGAGIAVSIASANVPPPHRPIEPAPGAVAIPAGGLKIPVVVEIVEDGPIGLTLPATKQDQ